MIRIFDVKYLLFALDEATNQPSIDIPIKSRIAYIPRNEAKNTQFINKIIDSVGPA